MTRLIRADVLKLRRRRGMMAVVALLVFAAVAVYFGVGAVPRRATSRATSTTATGVLTLLASVAGAIIGATAGGADIESGVFRDLVATGRSRTALFFSRVPAAPGSLTLGMLAIAVARRRRCCRPPAAGDVGRGGAPVLVVRRADRRRLRRPRRADRLARPGDGHRARLPARRRAAAGPARRARRRPPGDPRRRDLPPRRRRGPRRGVALAGAIAIILAWAAAALGARPLANPHPGDLSVT